MAAGGTGGAAEDVVELRSMEIGQPKSGSGFFGTSSTSASLGGCMSIGWKGPCRTAVLCGLLLAAVHAARVQRAEGDADATGAEGAGANLAADASGGAEVPFNEGVELAMRLGVQAQVGPCLEAKVQRPGFRGLFDFSTQRQDIVRALWVAELNRTTRTVSRHSLFASIQQKLLELLGAEEGGPVQPTPEEEARQRKYLKDLKVALKAKHDVDYDALKQECDRIVGRRFNNTARMVEQELSSGCQGKCTIAHIIDSQCQESAPPKNFCPEGTRCGCQYQPGRKLIETVASLAVGVYSAVKGVGGVASLDPTAALALPVGYLATVVANSRVYGCRCLPSPCAWHKRTKVCQPATAPGARNKYQDVMPYVGLKCVAREHAPSDWRNDPDFNPGCHEAQPCSLADARKIGRIGFDTFNCQYTGGVGGTVLFPPLRQRIESYNQDPVRIHGLPY
mmetsp:Transcript_95377/g.269949  ORF Transcript_95377/g.269949 Transcript_95377/m.269949 type:complete len:450 (+) Transcript_95377:44-1393(+)